MSTPNSTLTVDRLKTLLDYSPDTGTFTWLKVTSNRAAVGHVAGNLCPGRGYIRIGVDGKNHHAHRLAFLWVNGAWPTGVVDHIDGNRSNNAFSNLRDTTPATNQQNRRKSSKNNPHKLLGVSQPPGYKHKWIAKIYTKGKTTLLGAFPSPDEAHTAYLASKRKLHAGCTI